ncbi:MAG: hypothetical protein HYY57_03610, partial [Candidatus Omnitrophica bacterium]|nr:hypothetical protein [Candidatus Omnitrophota bacterium]
MAYSELPNSDSLQQAIGRYQAQLIGRRRGLGFLVVIVSLAAGLRLHQLGWPWPWSLGFAVFAAVAGIMVCFRWIRLALLSFSKTASHLDRTLGLKQRLVTAQEWANRQPQPALYAQLIADLERRCSKMRLRPPVAIDRAAAALFVLLIVLLIFPGSGRLLITTEPSSPTIKAAQTSQEKATLPQQAEEPESLQRPRPERLEPASRTSGEGSQQGAQPCGENSQGQSSQSSQDSSGNQQEKESQSSKGRQQNHSDSQQAGEQTQSQAGQAGKDQAQRSSGESQDSRQDSQGGKGSASQRAESNAEQGKADASAQAQSTGTRANEGKSGNQAEAGQSGQSQQLQAEIQQLLKEVSGQLEQLQTQMEKNEPAQPNIGTGTDPELYDKVKEQPGDESQGQQVPIGLESDESPTASERAASGVGEARQRSEKAQPQMKEKEVSLSESPTPETPASRQVIPPTYRDVFDRLNRSPESTSEK